MARIVLVFQLGILIVVGRYMLKQRNLKDQSQHIHRQVSDG